MILSGHEPKPFAEWIGRQSSSEDVITERLDASFRAIFEPHLAPVAPGAACLGVHWCLSPAIATMAELGEDGHPARNRTLPPISLPRRMWAGGAVEIFDALRIGDRVTRLSTIADITSKRGKSGELCFVAVDHDYLTERGLAVRERHDIVYREAATGSVASGVAASREASEAERPFDRSWTIETSPTLLFRYSAITFNGHRIHYDLPYATGVEGYQGLVVHGPVQATLLLNLAAVRDSAVPGRFEYRGISPAIAGSALTIRSGADGSCWTQGTDGRIHMEAKARAL